MEMLQGVWKQHLRPRVAVGYGVKIFLPSPPNYVTRSPGRNVKRDSRRRENTTSVRFSNDLFFSGAEVVNYGFELRNSVEISNLLTRNFEFRKISYFETQN